MSGKKSTRKKPTVASLLKEIEAQQRIIENLRQEERGGRDLIWKQFDVILDTLAYNQIRLPPDWGPERFFPANVSDPWIPKKKDTL